MEWNRRAIVGGLAATILPLRAGAAPTRPADGVTRLEAAPATLRLLPKPVPATDVWAYNGQVPGPLIRVKQGEEVKVRLVNRLDQPTSISWHGVRIANAMDGVAGLTQKSVQPGESFDYRFTPPDAGLYWYHPHVFPQSAAQIGRGLYGVLMVEQPGGPETDLDLLVVIDEWSVDAKGQIVGGVLDPSPGESIVTVNSIPVPAPPIPVRPGTRVRLGFVNTCAARIAFITCRGMDAMVIAIDGQASEVFPPAGGALPIGPGARFEVVADLPPAPDRTAAIVLRSESAADRPLMTFATKGTPIAARQRVARLPINPLLPSRIPLERSLKRTLVINGPLAEGPKPASGAAKSTAWRWTLDGVGSDGLSSKPLFAVKRGSAVTIGFANKTALAQQMHVHGHVFRVLHDLDDGWDPYWRESILIAPGKTKHVAFIADNPGKWTVESLMLERQITGLAGWFEVV